jgi:hypothetical protein
MKFIRLSSNIIYKHICEIQVDMFSLQKPALIFVVYLVDHIVRCKKELTCQNNFPGSYKNGRNLEKLKRRTSFWKLGQIFYVGEG